MSKTIIFKRSSGETVDPIADRIRAAARADRVTGSAGFKEWVRERFGATLRVGKYGDWTSIAFKSERDLTKFWLTLP